MHILLTDVLTCPRCGPAFGLVVLADRIEERRVVQGHLGCPNCRSHYPIRARVADLRVGAPPSPQADGASGPADSSDSVDSRGAGGEEQAVRLAALMGLAGVSGMALLAGPGSARAAEVAALVPEVQVIALSRSGPATGGGVEPGVSRVLADGDGLPLRGGLRAAALTGGAEDASLREGLRVLAPGARLVVDPAPPETGARLRVLGAEVLLDEEGVVAARAPGRPVELRYNAVR